MEEESNRKQRTKTHIISFKKYSHDKLYMHEERKKGFKLREVDW